MDRRLLFCVYMCGAEGVGGCIGQGCKGTKGMKKSGLRIENDNCSSSSVTICMHGTLDIQRRERLDTFI